MTINPSQPFSGFVEDQLKPIHLPENFFTQVLPEIDSLVALRLLLYMFWHIHQQEGTIRYFRDKELASDPILIQMMGGEVPLQHALDLLVEDGIVLRAKLDWMDETYFFINSPQGRAALEAIENGSWKVENLSRKPIHLMGERPNIYELYEANIGPITPMMADILKEDEKIYPSLWIEEAIQIAVTHNARNWKYIQAILKRWHKEGRGYEQNGQDHSQDPSSYRKRWLGKK